MPPVSTGLNLISRRYFLAHQDPIEHATEIVGISMIRDCGTGPAEPLRVAIDQSTLDHRRWRPGDAITLISLPPEAEGRSGKLIIRRAQAGEVALILGEPPDLSTWNREWVFGDELHGPHFDWCFPAHWVETFFPGEYDADEHGFNSQTERRWCLVETLGQTDQIELVVGPEKIYLYLQRTSPSPTRLDVHLIPGMLHLWGWSRSTPLVLDSATDFDPFATEDALTIRECSLGEEANLLPTPTGLAAEVNPVWLDRFFPDRVRPTDWGEQDSSEPDLDGDDELANRASRHTLVVGYSELSTRAYALSFKLALPGPNSST